MRVIRIALMAMSPEMVRRLLRYRYLDPKAGESGNLDPLTHLSILLKSNRLPFVFDLCFRLA